MGVLKPGAMGDVGHYQFSDYEEQKRAYLQAAREEAEEIVKNSLLKARENLQRGYTIGVEKAAAVVAREAEEARKKGYEEGFKKGEAEARQQQLDKSKAALTPLLSALQKSIDDFSARSEEILQLAQDQLIDRAYDLARNVIACEVRQNKDVLRERLNKALDYLKVQMRLEVRLHPEDLAGAKELLPGLMEKIGSQAIVSWIEDPGLARGDVVAGTGEAKVELGNELQWNRLLEEIHGKEGS